MIPSSHGLPGESFEVAAHASRRFFRRLRRGGKARTVVHLDTRGPINRYQPELVLGARTCDQVCGRLHAYNVGVMRSVQFFRSTLEGHTSTCTPLITFSHGANLTADWHRSNCFLGQLCPLVASTGSTRPGDSMADLTFNCCFWKIFTEVRDVLQRSGVMTEV